MEISNEIKAKKTGVQPVDVFLIMLVMGSLGWFFTSAYYENSGHKPIIYTVYKVAFTFNKCKCTLIKQVNGYQQLGDSIRTWTIHTGRDTAYVTHDSYAWSDLKEYSTQRY